MNYIVHNAQEFQASKHRMYCSFQHDGRTSSLLPTTTNIAQPPNVDSNARSASNLTSDVDLIAEGRQKHIHVEVHTYVSVKPAKYLLSTKVQTDALKV